MGIPPPFSVNFDFSRNHHLIFQYFYDIPKNRAANINRGRQNALPPWNQYCVCTLLYQQIGREAYEVIEGVCIKLKKAALRKQRSLCLLTDTGAEHSLTLGEKTPICIGHRYRFFYLLSESNAAFIHAHQFLALEDLGEFTANYEEFENNSK